MAIKYLGNNIDIHGGGQDLIFPHHENEIAQSEGLSNSQFAKLWLHVGMVTIKSEKMSKSIGNTIKISELLKEMNFNIIRLFCLSSHYSKPLDYSNESIDEIRNKWSQVENAYFELKYRIDNNVGLHTNNPAYKPESFKTECIVIYDEFEKFFEENLNFSNALASFFKFINKVNNMLSTESFTKELSSFSFNLLEKFMFILGLKIKEVSEEEKHIIEKLIENRNVFRKNKNYGESDKIRKELFSKYNIELIDHKDFTVWKKVK